MKQLKVMNSVRFEFEFPLYTPLTVAEFRARILKHFKVTAEKIALGKVNFSNGILKQPDFSLTAVRH